MPFLLSMLEGNLWRPWKQFVGCCMLQTDALCNGAYGKGSFLVSILRQDPRKSVLGMRGIYRYPIPSPSLHITYPL